MSRYRVDPGLRIPFTPSRYVVDGDTGEVVCRTIGPDARKRANWIVAELNSGTPIETAIEKVRAALGGDTEDRAKAAICGGDDGDG